MKEDTIENINRDLLFTLIEENEFLAVFFCKFLKLRSLKRFFAQPFWTPKIPA